MRSDSNFSTDDNDAMRADGARDVSPTPFMRVARERADLAMAWLLRSIEACGGNGSAVYYSRWYLPMRGWYWPYPETTGYLIPTLFRYARWAGAAHCREVAIRQADWICSLQYDDGSLPGSHVERGQRRAPSVFNTGQMVLGLVAAFDETGREDYLYAAARAARWLADGVDPANGTWKSHAYVAGFSPAYHSRVCWPMLEVNARRADGHVRERALMAVRTIAGWQHKNGAFQHWGFSPSAPAFTHTIAYVIRGLLESARLLGDDGRPFEAAAIRAADRLRRRMELRGRLAGAYDESWRGRYWYSCLTGNCQLALIWMQLADRLGDLRYLSAALKALQFVVDRQRVRSIDPNLRGAIPGSSPLWGRYVTMRYPNWAAKFHVDALMTAHDRLGRLLKEGPCASS